MAAAKNGDNAMISKFLDEWPALVNMKDPWGWTSLMWAAMNGRKDTVEFLLKKGARPDAQDEGDWTASMIALRYDNPDIAKLLDDWQQKKEHRRLEEEKELEHAISLAKKFAEEKETSDTSSMSSKEIMAFHEAARNGYDGAIMGLFQKYGTAIVDLRDSSGVTALMFAAGRGQKGTVSFLLEKGASIDAVENEGFTALMGAAIGGWKDVVALLLEKGADAGRKRASGDTALSLAKQYKNPEVVALLEQHFLKKHQEASAARIENLKKLPKSVILLKKRNIPPSL